MKQQNYDLILVMKLNYKTGNKDLHYMITLQIEY